MAFVIELEHVSKVYGGKKAVDDLSLAVDEGSVVALLGPNGAGKTTSVSMMLGLTSPSAGTVRLFGRDPRDPRARRRVGAMLQEGGAIDGLTVRETIDLFRHYYENPLALDTLLTLAGLTQDARKMAVKLSGGQRRRLEFALALAGDPSLVFLDEPTVGMDVTARHSFWDTLRELTRKGTSLILTTHYLEEADAIADRIIVIDKGKKVADDTPSRLKASVGQRYVSCVVDPSVAPGVIERLPGIVRAEWSGRHVRLETEDTDQLLRSLIRSELPLHDFQVETAGLTDVFNLLTETEMTHR